MSGKWSSCGAMPLAWNIAPAGRGIIWQANFLAMPLSTSANAAALTAALAAMGLTFTRASSATVQTSATTVVTSGIGVDVPRIGDDGGGQGLVLEEPRTNSLPGYYPRDPANAPTWGWTQWDSTSASGGDDQEDAGVAPNGLTNAHRASYAASTNFGAIQAPSLASGNYVASAWAQRASGAASGFGLRLSKDSNQSQPGLLFPNYSGGNWSRAALAFNTTSGAIFGSDNRPSVNPYVTNGVAMDAYTWGYQIEAGPFPTELILTSGATASRSAERLSVGAGKILRNGRVAIEMRFRPKGLASDMYAAGAAAFFAGNANNPLFYLNPAGYPVQQTTGGGISPTSAMAPWAIGNIVDIFFEMGNGVPYFAYRVNGGSRSVVPYSAGNIDPITSTSFDFFSSSGIAYFITSRLQLVRAYAPGRRPAWAA